MPLCYLPFLNQLTFNTIKFPHKVNTMTSINSLPFELIDEISSHIPASSRPAARLTSRAFHASIGNASFQTLASFIDEEEASARLHCAAASIPRRSRAIWSPSCSVPAALPLPKSFLLAMYTALGGESWPAPSKKRQQLPFQLRRISSWGSDSSNGYSSDEDEELTIPGLATPEDEQISIEAMAQRLGRSDVYEASLRQALFRYALFLSYIHQGSDEPKHLWVMSSKRWAEQQ